MTRRRRLGATLATSALALAMLAATASAQQPLPPLPKPDTPPPVPPILQNYKPVTADRLKQPEDGDWLMYRRTYDGWGYSPLSQITTDNAAKLKPVWTLATGQIEGHQAPPIVNNGVMFVATPGNQLLAIDAAFQTQNQVGVGILQNGTGPLTNYYTIDTASSPGPAGMGESFVTRCCGRVPSTSAGMSASL